MSLKQVYIETLGCPKNTVDSQIALGILNSCGFESTDNPESADVILINTCGFINDAKKESIAAIFEFAENMRSDGHLIVSGCLSQRYGEELKKEIPEVDVFLGVNDYGRIPEIIKSWERDETPQKTYLSKTPETPEEYENLMNLRETPDIMYSATLKISEGCNNRCAYCVIPEIRGDFRSRKREDILAEAHKLVQAGAKELILIAQDVTAYGMDIYDGFELPALIRELCKISDLKWLRLMYCYEDRITDELIKVMAEEEKVCPYIDMPVQHISDVILKAMGRRSTKDSILSTIRRLRETIPDIHIRTTLITGFPGERAAQFDELLEFIEETKLDRLGAFAYSKEEGTPAATMTGQVRENVKQSRLEQILRSQLEISLELNKKKIGMIIDTIIEDIEPDGTYVGRTIYDAPEIDNGILFTSDEPLKVGDIVPVTIVDAFDYDLTGEYRRSL